ncbi:hypothetical protein H1W37_04090 [Stappia taiwanensis]|uniref:Animal haem peroxidase n=1 Tax=Stappia taiwanensis TaxID=992267 RepID=A0A838XLU3_9HYPH|nr:peroxidase family protein [Stappia taiwanensis]MBA4610817.1 hypothetical protein [Stappia taiwanensis]GGE95614.1 hypothetical protein GCM10007285_24130 [Stappia taiwanensis]
MHGGLRGPSLRDKAQQRIRSSPADETPEVGGGSLQAGEEYIGLEDQARPGCPDIPTSEHFFALLARKMERTRYPWSDGDGHTNPHIPAGYTYLAQFVAHDLTVNNGVEESRAPNGASTHQRPRPLNLDTLYGDGPTVEPACFELVTRMPPALRSGWPKTRFRLDGIAEDNGLRPADSARCPRRDIGRALDQRAGVTRGTALIADTRNDDNAVLSQLTALFQIAHNLAMDRLEQGREPATPQASFLNFMAARGALTFVYHQILRHDLLPHLLDPHVRQHFETHGPIGPVRGETTHAPLAEPDFTNAAFRVGHAMVRERYAFTGPPPAEHRLIDVLRRTSERNPRRTPHGSDWIISWSNFFDTGPGSPQPSARLSPQYEAALWDDTLFPPMETGTPPGLAYRDLVRCTLSGVRKISALSRHIESQAPALAACSPWLTDPAPRHAAMATWLDAEQSIDITPYRAIAIADPPPLLYFLVEAAASNNGHRSGPLASVVIANNIYLHLDDHTHKASNPVVAEEAAKVVFGPNVPNTMPELIKWTDRNLNMREKTFRNRALPLS